MYRRSRVARRPYYRRRRRYDSLTGGTKDVNPQWFRGALTLTANSSTEDSFQLPITRIPTANKVTIIEVLSIQIAPKTGMATSAVCAIGAYSIKFATSSLGTSTAFHIDDPRVIAEFNETVLTSATGAMHAGTPGHYLIDLSDGAGHGILVASDKIYVQCTCANVADLAGTAAFAIKYRFKTVGMREYVGIVQSQQ